MCLLLLCSKSETAYSSLKKNTTYVYHDISTGSYCRVPDIINSNYNLHLIDLLKDWESSILSKRTGVSIFCQAEQRKQMIV